MRRMIRAWMALILALSFATIAAAQGTGRIAGEVLDLNGKPYPDVNVEIKNPDTGQAYTTKTDKNGRFTQLGLLSGIYVVTLTNEKDHLNLRSAVPRGSRIRKMYSSSICRNIRASWGPALRKPRNVKTKRTSSRT